MKYLYPRLSNTLTFKRTDTDSVTVTNHIYEENYILRPDIARFMRQLDGYTDPYRIPSRMSRDEIGDLLDYLAENELIRTGDTRKESGGTFYKTLWIPRLTGTLKLLAGISNFLLMILWLPVLTAGICLFYTHLDDIRMNVSYGLLLLACLAGIVCGMFLHELGHAFAALSYNAFFFEMGVMVSNFVLPGAYVLLDCNKVRNRLHKTQINAAGIESNLLLSGILLIAGTFIPVWGLLFFTAAFGNIIIAAVNLAFLNGFDGAHMISNLLGVDNLIISAKTIVLHKKARQFLKSKGIHGYALIAVAYIVCFLQIFYPVFLLMNIVEVILLWYI